MTHSTLQVFYDSRCPLCSREIRYYQRLAPTAAIEWIDIFQVDVEQLPVARDELLKVIHGCTADGELITGVAVLVGMWQRLPGVWPWLARLVSLPVVRWLTAKGYAAFARRRFNTLYCDIG